MRSLATLLVVTLALSTSGCLGGGDTGTFTLLVTDQPNAIDQFESLEVTVESVVLFPEDGEPVELDPAAETFDLTQLLQGNTTTLVSEEVPVGSYTRLELQLAGPGQGVLKDGGEVDVQAPGSMLFLTTPFVVQEGEETVFLFDIQVIESAPGKFLLKPNAQGSGAEAGAEARPGRP